jgi:hypothetical protein
MNGIKKNSAGASLSPGDKVRLCLKKAWKALPTGLRELPLKALCLLRTGFRRRVPPAPDAPLYIIGNFQAGGGISRSAQLYAKQAREKVRHCICVDVTREMLQAVKSPIADGSVRSLADVRDDRGSGTAVIHLNPPQFLWLLCRLGRSFLRHKHIVAFWAWELEDIPSLWKFALGFVDAVETPSTFTRTAIARNTDRPVTVRPDIGMVGSSLVRARDGLLQTAAGVALNPCTGITRYLLEGLPPAKLPDCDEHRVESRLAAITGASCLVSRAACESAGLMDESFYLYYEDVDWSLKIRKAGYALAWAKESLVAHEEGGSAPGGDGVNARAYAALVEHLSYRNRLRLMLDHYPLAVPTTILSFAYAFCKRMLRGEPEKALLVLRAACSALRGERGRPAQSAGRG